MAKKRRVISVKKKNVSSEVDLHIRTMLGSYLFVFEQRLNKVISEMNEIKMNLMSTQNLLEKNKIIKSDEFYKEYKTVSKELFGSLDSDGELIGNPVFSLYDA